MKPEIDTNKVVVFTGAGVSAESGLATFRDGDGLWANHRVEDVASIGGWRRDPGLVLDFYNQRRDEVMCAEPNRAHLAIAELQARFDTVVITQNVDDLHERAGSSQVLHLHGQILKSRSSLDPSVRQHQTRPIALGDLCPNGGQIRPDIVWFGEQLGDLGDAIGHLKTAGKVLVIGTSLNVMPAAGLLKHDRFHAEKLIIGLDVAKIPFGYRFLRGRASSLVPLVIGSWLRGEKFRP